MSLFVWVRSGTFPSAGHVRLLRERVLFEKPREFASMHSEASYDFSDWLFKHFLFCSAKTRALFSRSYIGNTSRNYFQSCSVENICQIKKDSKLYQAQWTYNYSRIVTVKLHLCDPKISFRELFTI